MAAILFFNPFTAPIFQFYKFRISHIFLEKNHNIFLFNFQSYFKKFCNFWTADPIIKCHIILETSECQFQNKLFTNQMTH